MSDLNLSGLLLGFEQSALGIAVRDLGGWGYALTNLVHLLGVAILFGSILLLDLRLLGWRRQTSLADISAACLPLARVGFALAVVSGVCMLSVNASEYAGNPFLLIKFVALILALINAWWVSKIPAWKNRRQAEPSDGGNSAFVCAGSISLLCWLTVVAAGRLIAYW